MFTWMARITALLALVMGMAIAARNVAADEVPFPTVTDCGVPYPDDQTFYRLGLPDYETCRLFGSGQAKTNARDYTGAIQDFTRALQLAPNLPYIYYGRGVARAYAGDVQGALDDFTQGLRLAPNASYIYYGRARVLA